MTTPTKPDRVHQIICLEIQDCEKAAEIVTAIRAVIAEELERMKKEPPKMYDNYLSCGCDISGGCGCKIRDWNEAITDAQKKVRGA